MTKLVAAIATLTCAACAATAAAQTPTARFDDRVVASVGDSPIVAGQLLEAVVAERKRAVAENRIDAFGKRTVEQSLQGLIDAKLFALAAREQGLDRRDDVSRRLEVLIDQTLAQAELIDVIARMSLSDDVLQRYFDAHGDAFRGAPRAHCRHIVVRTRGEADQMVEAIKGGRDFIEIARERNIDSTKPTGGDLGWVARGTMVAPFERAVFSLAAGEMSDVIETTSGFHIVRVEEIEAGKLPLFDTVKDQVRRRIIEERVAEEREQLIRQHHVDVRREVLDTVGR